MGCGGRPQFSHVRYGHTYTCHRSFHEGYSTGTTPTSSQSPFTGMQVDIMHGVLQRTEEDGAGQVFRVRTDFELQRGIERLYALQKRLSHGRRGIKKVVRQRLCCHAWRCVTNGNLQCTVSRRWGKTKNMPLIHCRYKTTLTMHRSVSKSMFYEMLHCGYFFSVF